MKKEYEIKRKYDINYSLQICDRDCSRIIRRLTYMTEAIKAGEIIIFEIDWQSRDVVTISIMSNAEITKTDIDYVTGYKDCEINEVILDEPLMISLKNDYMLIVKKGKEKPKEYTEFDDISLDDLDEMLDVYDEYHGESKYLAIRNVIKNEGMTVRCIIEKCESGQSFWKVLFNMPSGLSKAMLSAVYELCIDMDVVAFAEASEYEDMSNTKDNAKLIKKFMEDSISFAGKFQIDEAIKEGQKIEVLDLSVRSYNCLKRANITTIDQLQALSDEELHKIRNLGKKSVEEIKEKLKTIPKSEPLTEQQLCKSETDYVAELDKLIGLTEVKEQVKRITAFAKLKQQMKDSGKETMPVALNMVFKGNPGTAKTTVARIMAGILNEIGIISSNEVVEVGRPDLIGEYTGQTAPKVKDVFRRAQGKVLFIDEAYSLVREYYDGYGHEAISTMIQEMENRRDETIVIFAGYPEPMEKFMSSNPGLRSRVPFDVSFDDYSVEELTSIAEMEANKRGFSLEERSLVKIRELCTIAKDDEEFGNGRFSRNLVESAILTYATRVDEANGDNCENNFSLQECDFSLPKRFEKPQIPDIPTRRRIGFV